MSGASRWLEPIAVVAKTAPAPSARSATAPTMRPRRRLGGGEPREGSDMQSPFMTPADADGAEARHAARAEKSALGCALPAACDGLPNGRTDRRRGPNNLFQSVRGGGLWLRSARGRLADRRRS